MSILSSMRYVNIRHQLPQIGIRQQQAMGEKNGYIPAKMKRDYQMPDAAVHATQARVDINSYPSRTAYGFLNNTDFNKKIGDKGWQNIQSFTSKMTQRGWEAARNAARPGYNMPTRPSKEILQDHCANKTLWTLKTVPDPEFTVTPSRVVGNIDPGHEKYDISTEDHADIKIRTGSAETYIATEGFLRMWTTEGRLDTYA